MDLDTYRKTFFTDPAPAPRFRFRGIGGVSIDVEDEAAGVAFYTAVLGPPAYVEEGAHGWRLGGTWLTLLAAGPGVPRGGPIGFSIAVADAAEAERLQRAFADAGATITLAHDTLMYEPVRLCPVVDPFGTSILITAPSG
jgi:hypothetical protein